MRKFFILTVMLILLAACTLTVIANSVHSDHEHAKETRSTSGKNPWNMGHAPNDWWEEINRTHGHVGPWNVLGWRIGQTALKEFSTEWGWHEIDIMCYIPMATPYSCIADGLVIGTGNSIGRLDIRLAEVMSRDLINVAVKRKDGTGPILIFRPDPKYLKRIENRTVEDLEGLSRECRAMKESDLFRIERIKAPKVDARNPKK